MVQVRHSARAIVASQTIPAPLVCVLSDKILIPLAVTACAAFIVKLVAAALVAISAGHSLVPGRPLVAHQGKTDLMVGKVAAPGRADIGLPAKMLAVTREAVPRFVKLAVEACLASNLLLQFEMTTQASSRIGALPWFVAAGALRLKFSVGPELAPRTVVTLGG